MSTTKQCKNCQATYRLSSVSVPMRDKDNIECDFCGAELISWNGGIVYSSELLSPPPETPNEGDRQKSLP